MAYESEGQPVSSPYRSALTDRPELGGRAEGALDVDSFACLFGSAADALPKRCREMIEAGDWRYAAITGKERDQLVLEILRRIEQRAFSVVTPGDKSRWLKGWGENLSDFEATGQLEALVPRYIRPNQPVRLFGDFVRTSDPLFELHWYEVYRLWMLSRYFQGFEHVFEFGCGSGYNVAILAELFPMATITGLDWAQPSCDIVERFRTHKGLKAKGRLFDFFHPDESLDIPANSAVLTIGALEQTSDKFQPFVDFLLRKRPSLVVNIEPIVEWYNPDSLVDHLAIQAHHARSFLSGFAPYLEKLAQQGRIEILVRRRSLFGSLLMEGYSQLVWRPVS